MQAPQRRPIPRRPGSHVLRLGLGGGGGCALCVSGWECGRRARPGGASRPAGELSESSCGSDCRSATCRVQGVHRVLGRELAASGQLG